MKEIVLMIPVSDGKKKVWKWLGSKIIVLPDEVDKEWMLSLKRVWDVNITAKDVYDTLLKSK